jgi:uncharacterized protein
VVVGVARLEIFLPENHSLKEKRHAMTRIVERTKGKFNVSIMEIDPSNLWQRATIGFTAVGVNQDHVNSTIENVLKYIEDLYIGQVVSSKTEIIVIGDDA